MVSSESTHCDKMFNNSDALKDLYPTLYEQSATISGSRLTTYLQERQMDNTAESTPITTSPLSPAANVFVPNTPAPSMSSNIPATTYCPMSLQCPGHSCPSIYETTQSQSPTQNIGGNNQNSCLFTMQQNLLLQQQELLAAHHQLQRSAAVTVAAIQQQDEISNSLKMFAMMSALNAAAESSIMQHTPPLELNDFANNGHTMDELNQPQAQFGNIFDFSNSVNTSTISSTNTSTYTLNERLRNIWHIGGAEHVTASASTIASTTTFNLENTNPLTNLNIVKRGPKRQVKSTVNQHCVFCENNNEAEAVVKSHTVRDSLGRVLCPKLRVYICPICKASGDEAHTIKYCPKKPIITMDDALRADSLRLAKSAGSGSSQQKPKMRV